MRVIGALESDCDFGIDGGAVILREIRAGCEDEPVRSWDRVGRQIRAASIMICVCTCDGFPVLIFVSIKPDGDANRGLAGDCVENVRRDLAHEINHFPRRICVICRCCSAASLNSVTRSLASLRLRMASISSALLPVAHTM